MTRRNWVKEPYKSVFEERAETKRCDATIAIKSRPRTRIDWRNFLFVQFVRFVVLALMTIGVAFFLMIYDVSFHSSTRPAGIIEYVFTSGFGLIILCAEIAGVYAVINITSFRK